MSPSPLQKRPHEGKFESERQNHMKFTSDLKDFLLQRAPHDGFDPSTLSSLIDDFVLRYDGLDMETHTQEWNQVKEKLKTMNPSAGYMNQDMVKLSENLTKKDPIPAAAVDEKIMNEDETQEPMHVLISNGFEICVVDVKQRRRSPRSKVEYLKKIATLNLAEEQLPVSVGLFRLGSDAYMMGGHVLSIDIDEGTYPNPSMYDKNRSYYEYQDVKGTSSDTYCLYIATNGTLSPSKCNNILRLQTPKLRPVVAEIKGKLHVFDSFHVSTCSDDDDWIFSHEVIGEGRRWSLTIEPPLQDFISSYLVLGDHIYALTRDMRLLFDSIKLEWNSESRRCYGVSPSGPMFFKNVWDILSNAGEVSMCVEEITVGNTSYYLVLALVIEHGVRVRRGSFDYQYDDLYDKDDVIVAAYLVTSKGDIVGRQILNSFFRGPVQPSIVKNGAIIKGGGTDGKTMCIAFTGQAIVNGISRVGSFFFSNTFTVELVNNYASNIQRILEAGSKDEIAINGEVVRIHIKDRCVYKLSDNDGLSYSVSMEACFL